MKKIYLGVVICLAFVVSGQSQPTGNTWYYKYMNFAVEGYVKLEYVSDTLIGSNSYLKMSKQNISYNYISAEIDTFQFSDEFLRWDADSVFRLIEGNEYLMFAFNMQPSDTLYQRIYPALGGGGCDSIGKAIVDSIGTIEISGNTHRWISVSAITGAVVGTHGKIVEGIGPIDDYFFPEYIGCIMDANEGGPFRCHTIDEIVYYQAPGAQQCDYIIGMPENEIVLNVFPNPTSDILNISLGNSAFDAINIYNQAGMLVYSCASQSGVATISVEKWQPGLYFIEAIGKQVFRGRFVKE